MDNRITLLGVVHFKKVNGIRSTRFNITYLSSGIEEEVKIKSIDAYGNNSLVTSLTNGMLVILTGQILYSAKKNNFIIKVDTALPIKDRSGLAEDTIIIQNGNAYNQLYINAKADNGYIQTHPKPIPGDTQYVGLLNNTKLKDLDLFVTMQR